jgi:hypothetical protein
MRRAFAALPASLQPQPADRTVLSRRVRVVLAILPGLILGVIESRPAEGTAAGKAEQRIEIGDARLFIPAEFRAGPEGVDLTLHLHGAATVVEDAFRRSGSPGVLVNVTLPGLSAVYADRFHETNALFEILERTSRELQRRRPAARPAFRTVTVTSFSAGFGGVREMLKHTAAFDRIDALVMADSIYAGYRGDPVDRNIDPEKMEGFLRFARKAAEGTKRMIVSHSEQQPEGYASTTETARYLIAQLGGERVSAPETWPGGMRLLTRFQRKGLAIYGFAGATAADHMAHLRHLGEILKQTRRSE